METLTQPAARRLERAITIATAIQLAASCALPVIVSAAGRSDLTVTTVAVTIGMLLLWLWARLRTPGHLAAGILLIAVPGGLALALNGSTLTAAAGLATAAILTASAVTGFRALITGKLGAPAAGHLGAGRPGPTRGRPVVLVTGASHGIGLATARLLAAHGYQVFGTSRKPAQEEAGGVAMLPLDVTSDASARSCVTGVLERAGRLTA